MPQESLAAGPDDPATRFKTARDEFARDLRDLHIQCGKPKQSALVAAAAKFAAEQKNGKWRLNAATLSEILNGKRVPKHEFLSALIKQLVLAWPAVGDYKQLWGQWERRWQDLMRLQGMDTEFRKQLQAQTGQQRLQPTDDASTAVPGEIREALAKARATVLGEDLLRDAKERSEQVLAAAEADAQAIRAQAHQAARQAHDRLQAQLADEATTQRQQTENDARLLLARAERTADLLRAEATYTADDVLHETRQEAEWERRDRLLAAIIDTEQQEHAGHAQGQHPPDEEQARNILKRAWAEAAAIAAHAEQEVEAARQNAYWDARADALRLVEQAQAKADRQAELAFEAEQVLLQARLQAAAIVAEAEQEWRARLEEYETAKGYAHWFVDQAQKQGKVRRFLQISTPQTGHAGIQWVAFSSDARLLAACDRYGWVRLWDPATGRSNGGPLTSDTDRCVGFSPDGRVLAASDEDRRVRLWDPITGKPVGAPPTGTINLSWGATFSPDSQLLAASEGFGHVRLWDPVTGEPVGEPLSSESNFVQVLAFRPDGQLLAGGGHSNDGAGRVWLWDPATQEQVGQLSTGRHMAVGALAFAPDGSLLATSDGSSRVWLWDPVDQVPIGDPLTHSSGSVCAVAFSPSSGLLASGGAVGQLLAGGKGQLLPGTDSDGRVWLWDLATQQLMGELPTGPGRAVESVAFSPDGLLLAVGCSDGSVWLWNRAVGGPPRDRHSSAGN
ncbi:hypothetical protein OG381_48535 (plasmid) [Streptomyces sp. NBC_00490]|uniref:WD40 repeat domain-containing protein n=1 Tax=Streptomyces sp. NBC_00490 TaxID=2903657 RepID=UPI002E188DB9